MQLSIDYSIRKRVLDLVFACICIVILMPLMVLIGLLVWWFLGRPILFRQERPGLQGKLFALLKFRTMTPSTTEGTSRIPDCERLSLLGRLLRGTSLDELPELINVVRGDMSIVGPRPLLAAYLPRYSAYQMRRHEVLPGITGWAQVNGRNRLTWDEKFALDVWYVDHRSTRTDLKILALTLWRVLERDGINHTGHVGAPEFMGSDTDSGRTLQPNVPQTFQ